MRRNKTGRVRVDFATIEKLASSVIQDEQLATLADDWRLTRHSAVYRCKDGSLTLCLVWHADNMTMTRTIRGLRPEAA